MIVCEGACTEPYYLDGLRIELGLANVTVAGEECGSDPASVVRYALTRFDNDPQLDKVFCLIDRDEHATFSEAQQLVRQASGNGVPINLIVSYPSFEFWYLLHFSYTRRPFGRSGNRSPGDNVLKTLRSKLPSYEKGDREIWKELRHSLPKAIKHSRKAKKEAIADGEHNPSTDVHILVQYLFGLTSRNI